MAHALVGETVPPHVRGRYGSYLQSGSAFARFFATMAGNFLAPWIGWRADVHGVGAAGADGRLHPLADAGIGRLAAAQEGGTRGDVALARDRGDGEPRAAKDDRRWR